MAPVLVFLGPLPPCETSPKEPVYPTYSWPPCFPSLHYPYLFSTALTIIYVYVLLNLSCSKQLVCLFYLKNYFHFFLLMCGVSVHVHAGVFRGQKMAPDALSWITV